MTSVDLVGRFVILSVHWFLYPRKGQLWWHIVHTRVEGPRWARPAIRPETLPSGCRSLRQPVVLSAWPAFDQSNTLCTYGKSVWANVPADVARLMPWASAIAIISALAAAILWPRVTTAAHWSALGLSMMLGLGLTAITIGQHQAWLAKAPQKTWTQIVTLLAMLVLGFAVQWKLLPKAASKAPAPKSDRE